MIRLIRRERETVAFVRDRLAYMRRLARSKFLRGLARAALEDVSRGVRNYLRGIPPL